MKKKPSKKRCEKRVEKRAPGPVNPGDPWAPTNTYKINKTHKASEERHMKKDTYRPRHTRPFNTPRAPSGPERIYLSEGSPRGSGDSARRSPDTSREGTGYRPLGNEFSPSEIRFATSSFHFPASRLHFPVSRLHFPASSLQFQFSNLHFHIFGVILITECHVFFRFCHH